MFFIEAQNSNAFAEAGGLGNHSAATQAKRRKQLTQPAHVKPSNAAKSASNVSSFVFQWTLPSSPTVFWGISSQKSSHDQFNRLFVSAFPRLLYTNPSSSYTDEGAFSRSSIHAVGETNLSPSAAKSKIMQIAAQAGISGDPMKIEFSQKTIMQLQDGETLKTPKSPVDNQSLKTANKRLERIEKSGVAGVIAEEAGKAVLGEDFDIFGVKIPKLYALMAVGVVAAVVILKK